MGWIDDKYLSKLILFGEGPLRRALQQYVTHYHEERNHQGKPNRLLFSLPDRGTSRHEPSFGETPIPWKRR